MNGARIQQLQEEDVDPLAVKQPLVSAASSSHYRYVVCRHAHKTSQILFD